MFNLWCVIGHISYHKPEKGWTVVKVNVKEYNGIVYAIQNLTLSKCNPKLKERLLK